MSTLHYVGLDVHKETIDVTVYKENDPRPYCEKRIPNRDTSIKKLFKGIMKTGSAVACYEAGCMGFTLQRTLERLGVTAVIAAPGKMPRRSSERVKTDRRDARTLATYLRNGDIEAIRIPTEDEEVVRDYLRGREDVRLDLARTKQRLHKFLLRHGYVYESVRYWTGRHEKWLRSLEFKNPLMKETFDEYHMRVQELEGKLRMMDKRVEEIALSEQYSSRVKKLRCFKGIDFLTALTLVVEVGDFKRFKSAEAFMAFLGLVPREYSSGGKRRQGGITKSGNTHVRRLLMESSWHYRYSAPPSKQLMERRYGQPADLIVYADRAMKRLQHKFFKLVLRGKTSQVAVTAVARELAGFVWGMMAGCTA
jgi:transposase